MITGDAFRDQPVLRGSTVRLEPLTAAVLPAYLHAIGDGEVGRLTGTHASFTPETIEQ